MPWQRLGVLLLACLALGFGFKGAIVSRADKTGGQTTAKRGLVDATGMEHMNQSLKRMERYWTEQIRYIY